MSKNHFHVVKDPVHGTMQFTSDEDTWIKPFINSPAMQRLRHIKQLGLADYIFPGAVHPRFNHSIGCCYVSSQIANKIQLPDQDKQLVMIACLLHDIGHGPFSHAFEGIFTGRYIHHEAWTPYFLADYRAETFFQKYNQQNPSAPLNEDKFEQITRMIMHQPVKRQVLADIVSSQLDADRLDYLLRDSYFCGVKYGEFDFRWMLHCLAIIPYEGKEHLGITHKGIGVFESYLMARRLIMRNIGQSMKKLAIERMLINLLSLLSSSLDDGAEFAIIKQSRLGQFLSAAHAFNQQVVGVKNCETLIQHFLRDNYAHYKHLCDYDVFWVLRYLAELNHPHPVAQLAQAVQYRQLPVIVRIHVPHVAAIEAILAEFKEQYAKQYLAWQLQMIICPSKSYTDRDPVLVLDEDGSVMPITGYSLMINMMSDRTEAAAFLMIDEAIAQDKAVIGLVKKIKSLQKCENATDGKPYFADEEFAAYA